MKNNTHLLVVADPSSGRGESALPLARQTLDRGGSVTVVTFLSGEEGAPLGAFAEVEEVSLIEASEIYLRQVAERLGGGEGIATTSVLGADPAGDLLAAIEETGATVIALPGTVAGRHRRAVERLTAEASVPVVIAPSQYEAAG